MVRLVVLVQSPNTTVSKILQGWTTSPDEDPTRDDEVNTSHGAWAGNRNVVDKFEDRV